MSLSFTSGEKDLSLQLHTHCRRIETYLPAKLEQHDGRYYADELDRERMKELEGEKQASIALLYCSGLPSTHTHTHTEAYSMFI